MRCYDSDGCPPDKGPCSRCHSLNLPSERLGTHVEDAAAALPDYDAGPKPWPKPFAMLVGFNGSRKKVPLNPDYVFPNAPRIPTKVAVFDDSRSYASKCKRHAINGIVPCYCCPGECVGEPSNAAQDDAFIRDFAERMTPQEPRVCPSLWLSVPLLLGSLGISIWLLWGLH